MRSHCRKPNNQPRPHIPGLNRRIVKAHAERLFRDVISERPLTEREWGLVEEDLARKIERDGL